MSGPELFKSLLFWIVVTAFVARRVLRWSAAHVAADRPQVSNVLLRFRTAVIWLALAAAAVSMLVIDLNTHPTYG